MPCSYRPVFHFSPARGWMNDPNGLVWHNGRWHLCYQHAPDHVCWDPGMHWGHAVSHDLTHWEHWPIALFPDELGAIFSGSVAVVKRVEKRANSSLALPMLTSVVRSRVWPFRVMKAKLGRNMREIRSWQLNGVIFATRKSFATVLNGE